MILVLHIVVFCRFTFRSYAGHVLPVSYAWSTYTGPVSGEVHQVKPLSYEDFESSNGETESNNPDYVAKPDYSFAYGVNNPNTGDSHGHSETRDGSTVTGEYTVMEPDGVLRRVKYTADPKNGFRASVQFLRPDSNEESSPYHGERYYGYSNGGEHDDRTPSDDVSFSSSPPPPPLPPSLDSVQYESEDIDDEPYVSHPTRPPYSLMPQPQAPPFHFDFDEYRINSDDGNDDFVNDFNNNVVDVGDDGNSEDDRDGPFKFSSGYITHETGNARQTMKLLRNGPPPRIAPDPDKDDGPERYYRQGAAFGPASLRSSQSPYGILSSPSPFGLPSSPSPSFGFPPTSSSLGLSRSPYVDFPNNSSKRPPPPSPIAQPCAPPTSTVAAANDRQPFRSLPDPDDDSENYVESDDIENYVEESDNAENNVESDDNHTDTTDLTTVRPPPPTTSTPTLPSIGMINSTPTPRPSPFRRLPPPSRRPALSIIVENLSPSSTMTPIEPTIIDIDG